MSYKRKIPTIGVDQAILQGKLKNRSDVSKMGPGAVIDKYGTFSKAAYHEYLHCLVLMAESKGQKKIKCMKYGDFLKVLKVKVDEIKTELDPNYTGVHYGCLDKNKCMWSD